MSKRACVRTPLGMRSCRPDVRSPAPAWYRLGSKIQVHHWVSRIDWTKIIPRASLECRTCNISTEFMKLGRCEDGQLSCCTFVKLDLCPKRRTSKNKLFPGLRLKPWILPRQFDPSWTSMDGPQRLGRALRVSNVVVQNASEKIHGSTGCWFQFCLFLILPGMVIQNVIRTSSEFGS